MRKRTHRLGLALSALALLAAACSSGFSRNDAIATLIEDGGMTEAQAACVVEGIEDVDGMSIDYIASDADPSEDQREAMFAIVSECLLSGLQADTEEAAEATTTTTSAAETASAGDEPPGTDPALDALWVDCSNGDDEACDTLFWEAPVDSDYEAYGLSCGGRTDGCRNSGIGFGDLSPDDPPPGDDAELDALWVACGGGSASACDDLFFTSPSDSDYERFGFACGAREVTSCTELLGDDTADDEAMGDLTDFSDLSPDDPPPGENAEFDALWVACGEGSAEACDELFFTSPTGSIYERFGFSCGARAIGSCETVLG